MMVVYDDDMMVVYNGIYDDDMMEVHDYMMIVYVDMMVITSFCK
jgi:hypothetical protein